MNIHSTFYCHLCLFISLFFGQITAQNTLHIQDGTFLNIQADTWVNIQGENDTSLVNQGTINNFGTLNLTNTNSIALKNEGTLTNHDCAILTTDSPTHNSSVLQNNGLLSTTATSQNFTASLLNDGLVQDPNNSFEGEPIVNNGLVIWSITPAEGSIAATNSLNNNSSTYTVSTEWFTDVNLTISAGIYDAASDIFTADTTVIGIGVHTLYFEIANTNGGCTFVENIEITLTESNLYPSVTAQIEAILEGAFSGTAMTTNLNTKNLLPLAQPYNTSPWNYDGTEIISSIPANMVDWVLVELRDVNAPDNIVAQRAALLLSDGSLQDISGASGVVFDGTISGNYYIVLRHRNHLDVIGNQAIAIPNQATFSFTDVNNVFGSGQLKEVATGVYALAAGDFMSDGEFSVTDLNLYNSGAAALNSYINSDGNLDGHVTTSDLNLLLSNSSLIGVSYIRY